MKMILASVLILSLNAQAAPPDFNSGWGWERTNTVKSLVVSCPGDVRTAESRLTESRPGNAPLTYLDLLVEYEKADSFSARRLGEWLAKRIPNAVHITSGKIVLTKDDTKGLALPAGCEFNAAAVTQFDASRNEDITLIDDRVMQKLAPEERAKALISLGLQTIGHKFLPAFGDMGPWKIAPDILSVFAHLVSSHFGDFELNFYRWTKIGDYSRVVIENPRRPCRRGDDVHADDCGGVFEGKRRLSLLNDIERARLLDLMVRSRNGLSDKDWYTALADIGFVRVQRVEWIFDISLPEGGELRTRKLRPDIVFAKDGSLIGFQSRTFKTSSFDPCYSPSVQRLPLSKLGVHSNSVDWRPYLKLLVPPLENKSTDVLCLYDISDQPTGALQ